MKRFIVSGLESACTLTDLIWYRIPYIKDHVWKECRLAAWSLALDEKWETGCWSRKADK